ncbi:ABC transporter ATP-binding protein [Peptoniphilaceae bacterium SGI.137]|nr:ABC transporter ATP-binding protein [Peptoniphilaceae bacterium]MCI6660241.1 ABC transporter ATP-binding protein [Peptoniphilaceae bacterium]MDY3987519.1 ABC transporter ATP-binding protein [Peptoniphilaceae bacterium]
MQNAVELKGLKKKLGNFELGPIDLVIPQGCIVGYIGENGAGKSTTIKLLLNLMKPDEGEIKIFDLPTQNFTPEQKKDLAYVFDDLYLPGDMNLKNILNFHRKFYGDAWQDKTFSELNTRFQLPDNKAIKHFSRGMKMQLGMALALSHGAKLLLLDEATSGLDPVIRDDVLDLLLDYIQEETHTVLVSSHILSDLEKIADYIAFIHQGKLLFMETKDDLVNQYGIASLTQEQLQEMDPGAIVGTRTHQFGVEAMLKKSMVPNSIELEKVSVEDIMVFMIKGERK